MAFLHLPERRVSQYYCVNPSWLYSTSLSTAPNSNPLDPNKPTLLMIHACGSSSASQQLQLQDDRLRSAFNMIAMDSPYCGASTGDETDEILTIEGAADIFLCTLDKLYGDRKLRFSILAEGFFGSQAASWITHKRPEQVVSIVMASPGFMRETDEAISVIRDWLELACSNKNGNGDATGLLPEKSLDMINDYYFAGSDRDVERQAVFNSAYQQRYGAGHSTHDLDGLMAWFARDAVPPPVVAGIKVPVMILSGALDQASPLAAAEIWRDALTGVAGGVSIHQLPSAPHLLMYAESGVANRLVYRFFSTTHQLADPLSPLRPVSALPP